MGLKDQFKRLRENWLIIILILALMLAVLFLGSGGSYMVANSLSGKAGYGAVATDEAYSRGYAPGYYPGASQNFAPEVKDRKITKTSNVGLQVEYGEFSSASAKLKSITQASESFILNENVNKYDVGRKSYSTGYYTIKVDVAKYDSVVSQLKQVGEVQSFQESTDDITGSYTDLASELASEKQRLAMLQKTFAEATIVSDKITLTNAIFDQERKIAYLEELVNNMDNRISYSTIQLTVTEKRSEFYDVAVVKFSELIRALVASFNSMLYLVFILAPYALLVFIIWLIRRFFTR